eukprot:TRINITY_DN28452_c0_g1_i1.p1 TRINITY_DN28452_c0_g1~~TRINITY_DN28452_c0_g1_i1.p1  ORF type:complete len:142 (+),score=23.55 TRINITY_DN28452_c0_g1_i1:64-489(+)
MCIRDSINAEYMGTDFNSFIVPLRFGPAGIVNLRKVSLPSFNNNTMSGFTGSMHGALTLTHIVNKSKIHKSVFRDHEFGGSAIAIIDGGEFSILECSFINNSALSNPDDHTLKISRLFYNCLLYTSPSPRDGLLSRMPSSA